VPRPLDIFDVALIQTVQQQSAIVGNRYTDLHLIGHGEFSLVFRARDSAATRSGTAVKFIRPLVPMREPYRAQCFQREADLLWELRRQPDIIECHAPLNTFPLPATLGAGPTGHMPVAFYPMELGSQSVDNVIASGAWTPEQLLMAFRAMCRSIQRIHARGIVHRDLKPDNFVVTRNRAVKLADFGTARKIDGLPIAVEYVHWPGDTRHTAPEMFGLLHDDNPEIAKRADIFSLGTILFELFTGVKLGVYIFNRNVINDLAFLMTAYQKEQRQEMFDQVIPTIAESHPLPAISDFGAPIPSILIGRLDRLYREMAAIDYRHRQCNFPKIFHEIERCLDMVRRERAYLRLLEFRRRRHQNQSQDVF
jgi:serine/threonine protein kinase